MLSETFISSDFNRHEPLSVEFSSPHLRELNANGLQTRYLRRQGLVIEVPGGLTQSAKIKIGESLEFRVAMFDCEAPVRLLGVVETLVPSCRGLHGEKVALIGVRHSYLPTLISQKLEAHELMVQTEIGRHRSIRLPVKIPVDVRGIEVFSRLYILDLSMTGLFVSTQVRPSPGKILNFTFKLPFQKELISMDGKVIWNGEKKNENSGVCGFGLEYLSVSRETKFQLAQYISRSLVFPTF